MFWSNFFRQIFVVCFNRYMLQVKTKTDLEEIYILPKCSVKGPPEGPEEISGRFLFWLNLRPHLRDWNATMRWNQGHQCSPQLMETWQGYGKNMSSLQECLFGIEIGCSIRQRGQEIGGPDLRPHLQDWNATLRWKQGQALQPTAYGDLAGKRQGCSNTPMPHWDWERVPVAPQGSGDWWTFLNVT